MARKKKTDTKKVEEVKKPVIENVNAGGFMFVDRKNIPGEVLGRVYEINGIKARLVYIGNKCKFEIE